MVHTEYETLGDVIKAARQKSGLTIEELANQVIQDVVTRLLAFVLNSIQISI